MIQRYLCDRCHTLGTPACPHMERYKTPAWYGSSGRSWATARRSVGEMLVPHVILNAEADVSIAIYVVGSMWRRNSSDALTWPLQRIVVLATYGNNSAPPVTSRRGQTTTTMDPGRLIGTGSLHRCHRPPAPPARTRRVGPRGAVSDSERTRNCTTGLSDR